MLGTAGISSFTCNLLENMDYNQFDITLIMAVDQNGTKQFKEDELLKRTNNNVRIIRTCDLGDFRRLRKHLKLLKSYFKEYGPFDAVHANMDLMNGLVLKVAKNCKIPVRISHAHKAASSKIGSNIKVLLRKAYTQTMRKMLVKNATKLVGCSDLACNFMFGNAKSEVIINGIDTKAFYNISVNKKTLKEAIGATDKKVIITTARINQNKNPMLGIEITKELLKYRNDFVYLWYGNSENRETVGGRKSTKAICDEKITKDKLDKHLSLWVHPHISLRSFRYQMFLYCFHKVKQCLYRLLKPNELIVIVLY